MRGHDFPSAQAGAPGPGREALALAFVPVRARRADDLDHRRCAGLLHRDDHRPAGDRRRARLRDIRRQAHRARRDDAAATSSWARRTRKRATCPVGGPDRGAGSRGAASDGRSSWSRADGSSERRISAPATSQLTAGPLPVDQRLRDREGRTPGVGDRPRAIRTWGRFYGFPKKFIGRRRGRRRRGRGDWEKYEEFHGEASDRREEKQELKDGPLGEAGHRACARPQKKLKPSELRSGTESKALRGGEEGLRRRGRRDRQAAHAHPRAHRCARGGKRQVRPRDGDGGRAGAEHPPRRHRARLPGQRARHLRTRPASTSRAGGSS